MIKIEFRLFSSLEWKHIDITVIGENENACFNFINKEYPLDFRYKPYSSNPKEDSLTILDKEESDHFVLINNN